MRTLIAALAVVTAFVGGVYVGANPDTPVIGGIKGVIAPDQTTIGTEQVRDLIEQDFFEQVPESRLTNGSIGGMVKALRDPYTHYFTPRDNKEFKQSISGRYSGVGMAVHDDPKKRGLVVTATYLGSPAKRAGIKPGDLIIEVNGRSIAGQPSDLAVTKIKGPEGTNVTLTVRSEVATRGNSKAQARRIKLRRMQIDFPVAAGRIVRRYRQKIGVIELVAFTETAGAAVAKQIAGLSKRKPDGFVLDLRGNGGGRLDQAIAVASLFVPDGPIVATKGRTRKRRQYDALKDVVMTAKPLVVLVDKGSASASEIVAGALKFRDRALVVGTKTFGKGVFQEVTELKNGGAVSLTVGRYYLPGERPLPASGLSPDLLARDRRATRRDEALDGALTALTGFKKR